MQSFFEWDEMRATGVGLCTDGSIHTHQIKARDRQARRATLVEKAPADVIAQVLDGLRAVLDDRRRFLWVGRALLTRLDLSRQFIERTKTADNSI